MGDRRWARAKGADSVLWLTAIGDRRSALGDALQALGFGPVGFRRGTVTRVLAQSP